MKGSRAKKAAEAEAAASERDRPGSELEPTPPKEAREGAPRPGPLVQAVPDRVRIPAGDFQELVGKLRSNELLGAAAADAFEAAAGLRPVASPQSKGAKELRSEVAGSREDGAEEKPKKKGMNFDAAPIEEIPDLPPDGSLGGKKRPSLIESDAVDHDADMMDKHCAKDAAEPPELNLNPKQNKLRTDLEMWVMDEIPPLFGVDDSEELDESLQEDGQADQITFLIAEADPDKQEEICKKWLKDAPDEGAVGDFIGGLLEKVRAIQELGPKKKKKKKKDA